MHQQSGAPGGWICPACARHVPSKVETCRCGYTHHAPVGTAGDDEARLRLPVGVIVVLSLVAAGAAVWFLTPTHDAPRAAPVAAIQPSPATHDAVAAPTPTSPPIVSAVRQPEPAADSPSPSVPVTLAPALEDMVSRAMPAVS